MNMKLHFFIILFSQFFAFISWGRSSIDILPLQLELRYEDTSAQTKDVVSYQSLSIAYQNEAYRTDFLYSQHQDQTGNASLNIEVLKKEYLVHLGYQLFHSELETQRLSLDFFGQAAVGATQTNVTTTLLGSTTTASSDNSLVYGLGTVAQGHWHFLVLQIGFDFLTSKSFSPQVVTVASINFGFNISLP